MGFNSKNLLFNSIIDEVTSTMLYYNLILSYQYFKKYLLINIKIVYTNQCNTPSVIATFTSYKSNYAIGSKYGFTYLFMDFLT